MSASRKHSMGSDARQLDDPATGAAQQQQHEKRSRSVFDINQQNLNAVFENPLAGVSKEALLKDVDEFCARHNLMQYVQEFRKGALVSQNPSNIQDIEEITQADWDALEREHTHKWSQPWSLYWLVIMCSLAAAVQGMDETANNGAQAFYLNVRHAPAHHKHHKHPPVDTD